MKHVRTFFSRLWQWWQQRRLRIKVLIILAILIALLVALGGKHTEPVIESVVRQDLVRSVTATGTVVSTTDLALSFQETNLVRSVNVAVGQRVYKGQVLATLENGSEAAAVASARGALLAAQARERKALDGAGGDEVRVAEIAVESARRTLYSSDLVAKNDLGSSVGAPVISGTYNGSQAGVYTIEFDRSVNDVSFGGLERGRTSAGSTPSPLGTRGLLITFANDTRALGADWTVQIPNKDGTHYTANVNAYNDALAALELKKKVAPSDIDIAHADVVSAEGSLASAQAAFEKTVIRAPANGTVTKVDAKLGALVDAFAPVITVQDIGNLYVEAKINESGISHIAIGQPVTLTYDALGKDIIAQTTVSSVDLGATVVDGIVNYQIKAAVPDPTNVRSGMTANISVETARVAQALVIPERVITTDNGVETVAVLVDERKGTTTERTITTGLRGDGGLVEVTSGLSEGERVVFVPEK